MPCSNSTNRKASRTPPRHALRLSNTANTALTNYKDTKKKKTKVPAVVRCYRPYCFRAIHQASALCLSDMSVSVTRGGLAPGTASDTSPAHEKRKKGKEKIDSTVNATGAVQQVFLLDLESVSSLASGEASEWVATSFNEMKARNRGQAVGVGGGASGQNTSESNGAH
jgi:hypothetical protein